MMILSTLVCNKEDFKLNTFGKMFVDPQHYNGCTNCHLKCYVTVI